ncbi:hypothetical protein GCM10009647_085330 [Streptomyces sanglieri]|uniref:Uncharacterized protein n=1 Tax=Streptomyces sanglieri TaxID=193460 RepID=A0ABW2WND1_9ACTN|nr:hypothetical protein [Streptomyces sp. Wh19]MDV9201238.1 hypothetical protein [Streptomyces sp. Wh19]
MQSGAIKETTFHQHVHVGAHPCLLLTETFDIKVLSNLPKDLNCRLVESLGIKELKERLASEAQYQGLVREVLKQRTPPGVGVLL